jgi:hypothetical protein
VDITLPTSSPTIIDNRKQAESITNIFASNYPPVSPSRWRGPLLDSTRWRSCSLNSMSRYGSQQWIKSPVSEGLSYHRLNLSVEAFTAGEGWRSQNRISRR